MDDSFIFWFRIGFIWYYDRK